MNTPFKPFLILIPAAALLAGCGSKQTPQELVDARALYKRASSGPAATYDPVALHVARQSLVIAENFYQEHPDSQAARDLAYIAARRAQLAEARAQTALAQVAKRESERRAQEFSRTQLRTAMQKLEAARTQLSLLQQEKQQAEQRARQLQERLSQIAAVTQDDRGTVLTLSGSVLFPHGSANLLASARIRLDQVAKALMESSETTPITIQGFTDSTGTEQRNLELSQQRAEAVREYLVSKGVSQDLVQAEGMGESSPVADNRTAEGRANNRRVEIIVGAAGSAQPGSLGGFQRGQPSGGGINHPADQGTHIKGNVAPKKPKPGDKDSEPPQPDPK